MTEERRQILEMLAAGQINADEADRLLGALQGGSSTASATATATATATKAPKFLRIIVDAKEGKHDKPVHINVRVPIALLRAGVKLASIIPSTAHVRVNKALHEQGIDFDVSQIKPENLNEVIDQLGEMTVDVDQEDDDVKIKIFAE